MLRSWQRALDPATKSGAAQFLFPIKGAREFNGGTAKTIAGVTVRDDSTLVVTLAEPLAIFTKMLAMPVAAVVPDNVPANFGEHPIGTGPWKLVEWKHDDYLLFARNTSYYGGAPKTDSLRARIIAEPSTGVAEFESGNVDVLQIPASEASDWQEDESKKPLLMSTPALELVYVGINTTRGPLDRCARAAGDQLRHRHQSHHRATDQRPRHARRRRDSSRARRLRRQRASRIRTIPPKRSSFSPRPAIRMASTSSSGRPRRRSICASPRRCRPI